MSKETVEAQTSTFQLPNKVVKVMPVVRKGSWLPEGHDGEFLYTGAAITLSVPVNGTTGQLIDPLTAEEREYFEQPSVLSMKAGDLSIYRNKKENYWGRFYVKVDKDGLELDLSDPIQYLQYKVLKMNTDLVAPSFDDRFKGTPKFMLVDKDYQVQAKVAETNLMESVWMEFGAIKNSPNKLKNVLRMFHDKPVGKAKHEFLIAEVKKIIDEDPNKFINIITDKNFEMKAFVEDALEVGAIVKPSKNRYTFAGEPEEVYTLDQMIDELDPNGANQDRYLKIRTQIDESRI